MECSWIKRNAIFFATTNLSSVQITLDGLEETHNNSRVSKNGKPSYDVILKNIDYALKRLPDCSFSIRVNIGDHNRGEYPLLYKELMTRWTRKGKIAMYLSFIEDYGTCAMSSITSADKINYIKWLVDKYKIYENVFPTNISGVCCANRIMDYVIAPNGDLYKCWTDLGRTDRIVGSIFNPSQPTNYDLIAEYTVAQDKYNDSKCQTCFMLPVCRGGCPLYRYDNQHRGLSHDICPYTYENFDVVLEIMYERYLRNNGN